MQQEAKNLLEHHTLRKTDCRLAVLEVFFARDFAIGQAEIEEAVGNTFDRVTIYRTLKTFQDAGIIHKVLDTSGVLKYALCPENCVKNAHQHEHVHFKCQICGQTNCLVELTIPQLTLPQGYESFETNLLIQGICPECHEN